MSSVTPLNPEIPSLPERWAACSLGRDGARHVQTDEALALARAVEISLARNRATAELTRTAREWGARLPSPSAVVSAVASLREAVTSLPEVRPPQDDVPRPHDVPSLHVVPPTGKEVAAASSVVPGDSVVPAGDVVVPAGVLKVLDRVLSEAIEGVSSSLREAALIDPLTGCANRQRAKRRPRACGRWSPSNRARCRCGSDRSRRVEADQRHPRSRCRRLHASGPLASPSLRGSGHRCRLPGRWGRVRGPDPIQRHRWGRRRHAEGQGRRCTEVQLGSRQSEHASCRERSRPAHRDGRRLALRNSSQCPPHHDGKAPPSPDGARRSCRGSGGRARGLIGFRAAVGSPTGGHRSPADSPCRWIRRRALIQDLPPNLGPVVLQEQPPRF